MTNQSYDIILKLKKACVLDKNGEGPCLWDDMVQKAKSHVNCLCNSNKCRFVELCFCKTHPHKYKEKKKPRMLTSRQPTVLQFWLRDGKIDSQFKCKCNDY